MFRAILCAMIVSLGSSSLQAQLIPISARELVPQATAKAKAELAADAYLLNIVFASFTYSGFQVSMDLATGQATGWVYRYYSPSLDSTEFYVGLKILIVGAQIVKLPTSVALPAIPIESKAELSDPMLDSPAALQAVKDAGADAFLQSHSDAVVQLAIAGDNPVETPIIPAGKLWFFSFTSSGGGYACAVDAETGAGLRCGIVSEAPRTSSPTDPLELAVYPNPLPAASAAAPIRMTLRSRESVRLTLVDLLGRECAVLADGIFEPGSRGFAVPSRLLKRSGAYVLHAQTPSFSRSLPVVILR